MTEYSVQHEKDQASFVIKLADAQDAIMRYRLSSSAGVPTEVDFYTTFVPDQHRGKGLAGLLVNKGFQWADENQLTIKASCWYAAKKLDQRGPA